MANNPYKLENMLLSSSAHFRSVELKAMFKDTKDLYFKGFPKEYSTNSMTRMQGNRYLLDVRNCGTDMNEPYCVDLNSMTAENLELNAPYCIKSSFVDGEYMLLVRGGGPMFIFRDLVNSADLN